jgi:sterol desaturase/sphingolipid hydroxylase (fatty acid hydroxylase superfamily)
MASFRTAITLGLWPLVVVAGIAILEIGIQRGHDPAMVLFAVSVGTLATVLLAELAAPHRPEWSAFDDRQSLNDLGHGILQSQLGDRLGGLFVATLAVAAASKLSAFIHHAPWPTAWPMALQVLLGVVVADGLDYWKHRALHTEWGWRFHGLHHGITRLHALRSARSHFAEVVMRFVVVYAPLVALGAPRDVLLWHAALIGTLGMIGHSNVRLWVASPLHRILMTPHVHRLHHSNERSVADTNFANILPLWDVLFGTFSHPDEHVLRGVGVMGDETPSSFLGQVLAPFTSGRDAPVA